MDTSKPQRLGGRRVLFLCMGGGELLRLIALALLGASRFAAWAGPVPSGAWLLVYLAPHAAVASAFLFMAHSPEHPWGWMRLIVPAKLMGAPAAVAVIGMEIADGSWRTVWLRLLDLAFPDWSLLALVVAWDLGVLSALAILRLISREARRAHETAPTAGNVGPATPAAGTDGADAGSNPVYREADVETVGGDAESGAEE